MNLGTRQKARQVTEGNKGEFQIGKQQERRKEKIERLGKLKVNCVCVCVCSPAGLTHSGQRHRDWFIPQRVKKHHSTAACGPYLDTESKVHVLFYCLLIL